MATLPSWINPTHRAVVTPLKARACHALQAVLRGEPHRARGGVTLMPRGAERC